MNLFTFVWIFIAVILILQGIRSRKDGINNNKPFIFAAIAIVFVVLNLIMK